MRYGKTIELFLTDGTPEGLVTAELSNWNGKGIKISRSEIKDCKRDDIRSAGVYFLFCKEEDDEKESVYIGESENVYERLKQHINDYNYDKEKYYWVEAVAFIGNDLNKAMIRYLEHKFVEIAKKANRYKILTKNTYKNTILKESQIATMDEFIENVKIVINTLGFKVLVPVNNIEEEKEDYFYCIKCGANAKALRSSEGFIVISGSIISDVTTKSFENHPYKKLRDRLISEGVINDKFEFVEDYIFSSPSSAASIVLGRPSNGTIEWETKDEVTLKDFETM